MTVYVLTKIDWEFGRIYTELYENMLDAKNEMWNKVHFQYRARIGASINMVNDTHVILVKQDNEDARIVEFKIEERDIH